MDVMVVGIDVSKDRLDVAVRPTGESLIFKRTGVGIEDLIARLGALSPKLVAIEASGGFEAVVAAGLAGAGLPVVVVNPAQVRAFAQALGKRAKTDLIDAAVIAHFAEATKPKLRQMPDEVTRLLADLVARRRQIVEMIAAEAQRTRRMSDKRLTKSVARLRKALEKELSELDGLIDDQIREAGCDRRSRSTRGRSALWREGDGRHEGAISGTTFRTSQRGRFGTVLEGPNLEGGMVHTDCEAMAAGIETNGRDMTKIGLIRIETCDDQPIQRVHDDDFAVA
jgi:transposase